MTRFDWNGLRRGTKVFVHHSPATARRAEAADVVFVTVQAGGANAVGLRLVDGSVVWPSRLLSHHEPVASEGDCWRCAQPEQASA
jgi:hypothetical protein